MQKRAKVNEKSSGVDFASYHQFFVPAQLVRGFPFTDLLDKPCSQVLRYNNMLVVVLLS